MSANVLLTAILLILLIVLIVWFVPLVVVP